MWLPLVVIVSLKKTYKRKHEYLMAARNRPTNVTLPDGSNYGYHVGGPGGIGIDVVSLFVKEMEVS